MVAQMLFASLMAWGMLSLVRYIQCWARSRPLALSMRTVSAVSNGRGWVGTALRRRTESHNALLRVTGHDVHMPGGTGIAAGFHKSAAQSLRHGSLWDEIVDRLKEQASSLFGGRQQRLRIACAISIEPAAILLDGPTAALDPIAIKQIEDLIAGRRDDHRIAIATSLMKQVRRISQQPAFFDLGRRVEFGEKQSVFPWSPPRKTRSYTMEEVA